MLKAQKIISVFIAASVFVLCAISAYAENYSYSNTSRLVSEGKLDEAETALIKEISLSDKNASALSLLGEVYRKKRDYKKAVKFLNRAISADPKYPISYIYKGKLYFSMQKFDEVAAEFDLFVDTMKPLIADEETRDFYISSLHDISMTYFELKNYDRLRIVIDEILRLSPKDQTALYNLGVYYYIYERNRSRAYVYFSKVIDTDGSNPTAAKARYAIEFMRINPDARISPDFSFIDQEYRN